MPTTPNLVPAVPEASFDPASVRSFRFVDARIDLDGGRIELAYALDDREHFVEVVELGRSLSSLDGPRLDAVRRAVRLLHLIAGVSYYKSCFPPDIVIEGSPLDAGTAAFLSRLYHLGLAECRWQNDLVDRGPARFPGVDATVDAPTLGLAGAALVPVGGGKDSIVALEAVRSAGRVPLLFSVGESAATARTAATAGLDHAVVTRRISPRLLELNHMGAINGHVPVTAINSCLACIVAIIDGRTDVVMANERSASAGSLVWHGVEVNHQYSKSWDFEQRFATLVTRSLAADLRYFSLLRPWSELAIAQAFATMTGYHRAFISCNQAFLLDRDRRTASWCGHCAKCRFVFLALAPFLERERLIEIFDSDLLAETEQIAGYAEVLGIDADKPMDCVGEIEESRVAMRVLAGSDPWSHATVVRAFAGDPRIRDIPDSQLASVMTPGSVHAIPEPYERFASALG